MPYRCLVFDLFGTLVHFTARVPTVPVIGSERRSTMHWLRDPLAAARPALPFDEFFAAMGAVTTEIVQARPPAYREVPSHERFQRVLARVGVDGPDGPELARQLSETHMAYLAAQTEMPAAHGALLQTLAARWPLGLVSNFDHGATAHAILRREGIADLFGATVISADCGRRKPHPEIFALALDRLGVEPAAALYVGDTAGDDVAGARAAGMDVVWINAAGAALPADCPPPTHTVRALGELRGLLGI